MTFTCIIRIKRIICIRTKTYFSRIYKFKYDIIKSPGMTSQLQNNYLNLMKISISLELITLKIWRGSPSISYIAPIRNTLKVDEIFAWGTGLSKTL